MLQVSYALLRLDRRMYKVAMLLDFLLETNLS
jgi:hypothetical protein